MLRKLSLVTAFIMMVSVLFPVSQFAGKAQAASGAPAVLEQGFENGLTGGWERLSWGGAGEVAVSPDQASEGSHSLQFKNRSARNSSPSMDLTSYVQPGHTYDVSLKVKLGEGTDTLHVASKVVSDGTAAYPWIIGNKEANASEWTILEKLGYPVPDNTTEFRIWVESVEASSSTADIFIDEVVIIDVTPGTDPDPGNLDQSGVRSDFEDGQQGWKARNGKDPVSVSAEDAHGGDQSLLTGASQRYQGPLLDVIGKMHLGHKYNFSVWVKMAPGQADTTIRMSVQSGENSFTNVSANTTVTDDEWVQLTGTFTVSSAATILNAYVEVAEEYGETRSFYIDDFELSWVPTQPQPDIETDIANLKDVFADYFSIGAAVEPAQTGGKHQELLKKHYNTIVAENSMKPGSVQPQEGVFNWTDPDKLIAFAKENQLNMRYHTLVWHSQVADWMFEDENGKLMIEETDPAKREANKKLLLDRMREHITAVVEHVKATGVQVEGWDVVNEVIDPGGPNGMRNSAWYQITGLDYIREAFRTVHALDPDAKLYINDYGTNDPGKRDILYDLVMQLREEDAEDGTVDYPIHGVGHQTHINIQNPSISSIVNSIKKFGDAGFDNQITELDISLYTADNAPSYGEIPESVLLELAYRYQDLFDGLKGLEDSGDKDYISNVTFWGLGDDRTWLTTFPEGTNRVQAPFLFDKNLQSKLAYWAVADPSKVPVQTKKLNVTQGTPIVDGNPELAWDVLRGVQLQSSDGLAAAMKVLWDTDRLYVWVDVEDAAVHADDTVEWFVNGRTYAFSRSAATAVERTGGYRLEMSVPWQAPVQMDDTIAFDLRVTDADGTANASWSDRMHNQDQSAEGIGELTLKQPLHVAESVKGTPGIDGERDALWDQAEEIETGVWVQGTSGATAKARTMWDDDYLYVYAHVTDEILSKQSTAVHEQDSVEIFVDQNNAKTVDYQADDGQYRVNYLNERSTNPASLAGSFYTAAKLVDGGYVIEAKINLDAVTPVDGQLIGFDFQVNNDQDGAGGRDSVAIWNDASGRSWQDTSGYGVLKLVTTRTPSTPDPGNPSNPPGTGSPGGTPAAPSAADGKVTFNVKPNSAGKAEVNVSSSDVLRALETAQGSTLAITVNSKAGALKSTRVTVPVQGFFDHETIDTLAIQAGKVTVFISAEEAAGVLDENAGELVLEITEVDVTRLPEDVKIRVDGYPVYDFTLLVDDKNISELKRHSVTVEMDYELKPGEKPHQIAVYYIGEDGKLEVVKNVKYDREAGKITFSPKHFSPYGAALATVSFSDLNQAAWSQTIVETLASREVVHGTGDGKFEPNGGITRAAFVHMLITALELSAEDAVSTMGDVQGGGRYSDSIAAAEKLGIVLGREDGTFGVNDTITRQDMAVIAYRAMKAAGLTNAPGEAVSFRDAGQISPYAAEAVQELSHAGIINGRGNGRFQPKGTAARAEAAAIIYKLLGFK